MDFDLDDLYIDIDTPEFQDELERRKQRFKEQRGREPSIKEIANMENLLTQLTIQARYSAMVDRAHDRMDMER